VFSNVDLRNFGLLNQLGWRNLGKINLVISNNGCVETLSESVVMGSKGIAIFEHLPEQEDRSKRLASNTWIKVLWGGNAHCLHCGSSSVAQQS